LIELWAKRNRSHELCTSRHTTAVLAIDRLLLLLLLQQKYLIDEVMPYARLHPSETESR